MEELKKIIAANIVELRRCNHMTQAELAEKLCYSDKAISKWERGESIPDVFILKQVADMFSVTVDYLLTDHNGEKIKLGDEAKRKTRTHLIISLMSAGLVWLITTAIFVILHVSPLQVENLWLAFIYAIPICLIVILVFNSIWGKPAFNYLIISLLMWSILLSISLPLSFSQVNMWLIMTIGIPGQIIILLWSGLSKSLWSKSGKKSRKHGDDDE